MDDQLRLAKEYVSRHFPEMGGVEPTPSQPTSGVTVFTFRKTFSTPDGAHLSQVIRVSISEDGRVVKVATSKG